MSLIPLFNATAKIADEHITVKPGLDGLLAAGIIKEILRLGLEDRDFINNYAHGFADLLELLEGITIEKISEMTEVPIEEMTNVGKGVYEINQRPPSWDLACKDIKMVEIPYV